MLHNNEQIVSKAKDLKQRIVIQNKEQ